MRFQRRPDPRVLRVLLVLIFLAAVAVGWSMRRGRARSDVAPTPATRTAPGASGGPGGAPLPGLPPPPPGTR